MDISKLYKIAENLAAKAETSMMHNRIMDIQFHTTGYAEPGYRDPECGITATGNWNVIRFKNEKGQDDVDGTIKKLEKVLEVHGVKKEWDNEWTPCDFCGRLVRTQPNGYEWSPSYWQTLGYEIACIGCLRENRESLTDEYVEWLEGNADRAMTGSLKDAINLKDYGYVKLQGDFRNGMHYGMDADPKKIAEKLRELDVERFIFVIDGTSQFYLSFSVWIHENDIEKARQLTEEESDGPSVAGRMEANLKAATRKLDELADADSQAKIRYAKVTSENWEARLVDPDELINAMKGDG